MKKQASWISYSASISMALAGIAGADTSSPELENPGPDGPPYPNYECECDSSDSNCIPTTSSSSNSAIFEIDAGQAIFPRVLSMGEAASGYAFFDKIGKAANGSRLTSPSAGMGVMTDSDGRFGVDLRFTFEEITAASYKALALQYLKGYKADYIYAGDGSLRQLATDDILTDITPLPAGQEGYTIKTYRRADQVGAKTGGLYEINAGEIPFLESVVSNPDFPNYNGSIEVKVTERIVSNAETVKIYAWTIDPQTKKTTYEERYPGDKTQPHAGPYHAWKKTVLERTELTGGDFSHLRSEYVAETPSPEATGAPTLDLVERNLETYTMIKGKKRLIQLKTAVDASGAATADTITTDHTYYSGTNDMLKDGRPDTVVSSNGGWTKYEYAFNATAGFYQYKTYTPFKNSTIADLANARLQTVTVDGDDYTKTVTVAGQKVSSSSKQSKLVGNYLIVKNTRTESGGGDLVSYETYHKVSTTGLLDNRIHSRVNEDGTVVLYSYTDLGGGAYSETKQSGAGSYDADGKVTSVTSGRQTVSYHGDGNRLYQVESRDIESGLALGSWSAFEPNGGTLHVDAFGRSIRKYYNGDINDVMLTTYGCCGIEATTSRTGENISYFRDPLKRETIRLVKKSSTDTALTITTNYDGLTKTVTQSSGGTTLLVSQSTRDMLGRIVSSSAPDADGDGHPEETTYSYTYPGGQGLKTTIVRPDTSTAITERNIDGSTAKVYGTGVVEMNYDYGAHDINGGGVWKKHTRANGTEWTKSYSDHLGRGFKIEYADGAVASQTYHPANAAVGARGKMATSTDPDENANTGKGSYLTYAYNAEGERTTTTEALADNHTRTTVTDTSVVTDPDVGIAFKTTNTVNGTLTNTSYRSVDGYTSKSVGLGATSSSSRSVPSDGSWTVTRTSPDGQRTVQTYTHGRLQRNESFDNGASPVSIAYTSYLYDDFGRTESTTDSRTGATTIGGYTEAGQATSVTTNGGNDTTSYDYDSMGRRTETTLPDNSSTHTSYTLRGQTLATWGSQTYARLYQYDTQGRMSELRTYQNLAHGTEPKLATAGYASTEWIYDSQRGWLTEKNYDGETDNGVADADYTYTASGRLAKRTWERGVTTTYTYDQGSLKTVDYSDSTAGVSYTYDNFGRHLTVTQAGNTHTYAYDATTMALDTETISYDTDDDGTSDFTRVLDRHQDSLLRPTGYSVEEVSNLFEVGAVYGYDAAGRLEKVHPAEALPADPASADFTYTYEPGSYGLVETVKSPVHLVTNTYEANRNVLDNKENAQTPTPSLISKFDYSVNNLGQRTVLTTTGKGFDGAAFSDVAATGPAFDWKYNGAGELQTADNTNGSTGNRAYTYDGIGNRKTAGSIFSYDSSGNLTITDAIDYTANALNQYEKANGVILPINAYDDDGNLAIAPLPKDQTTNVRYVWDAENRLVKITDLAGTTTIAEYTYDYLGRRISKTVGSATIRYIYDGWNPVTEYTGTTLSKSYTWGMDLSGSLQGAGGVGGLLAVNDTVATYYPTYDGNGNVSEYLDSTGSVQAHYEYDAFGNTLIASGDKANEFSHRFSTKPLDAETGLCYYGYRYYDPVTGRWPSRDPIGERGGMNVYGFVDNTPINAIDVNGQFPWVAAAIGAMHLAASTAEAAMAKCKEKECINECESCCNTAHGTGQTALLVAYAAASATCTSLAMPWLVGGCLAYVSVQYGLDVSNLSNSHESCIGSCADKS